MDECFVYGLSIFNRAMENCKSFFWLSEKDCTMSSAGLIRAQIDNLVSLYALVNVDDPNDVTRRILEGEQLNQIKDNKGKQMNGSHLVKKYSQEVRDLKLHYNSLNPLIHFSIDHIRLSAEKVEDPMNESTHRLGFHIDGKSRFFESEFEVRGYFALYKVVCEDLMEVFDFLFVRDGGLFLKK